MYKLGRAAMRYGPALAVMLAIFWFSSLPDTQVTQARDTLIEHLLEAVEAVLPDAQPRAINWLKAGHAVGYALLGAAYLHAVGPTRPRAGLWAALAAALYAVTDELHQTFVPGRSAGLPDVLIDTAAAGVVIILVNLGRWRIAQNKLKMIATD